ncbi:hypothetical protein DPMN_148470 [Dreissena polymorpha]|uniref:Uncharacterized protein n=1 Tax=Dreissena polymorpha TaxID=45954 RepID=A0A9D4J3W9_DREPO|nr:hypothetical protein DPMN_148470 [Dreissena polymorpha]
MNEGHLRSKVTLNSYAEKNPIVNTNDDDGFDGDHDSYSGEEVDGCCVDDSGNDYGGDCDDNDNDGFDIYDD